MGKLRTMKLDEITLHLDPHHSDTVLIYVSRMATHYERAWCGGTAQEAADIVIAWDNRDFDRVRLLLRGKGSTTEHGDEVCDVIDAHLAAQSSDSASDENYTLDASGPDTWGIGNKPHAKVKQWKPDKPDPDVDLMKSIRDVCHR